MVIVSFSYNILNNVEFFLCNLLLYSCYICICVIIVVLLVIVINIKLVLRIGIYKGNI